jgi:hypothetical protein
MKLLLFLSGLFFANGVPHFVHGISGENFHNPTLHRFMPQVPSPLFNVIWGMLSFSLAVLLASRVRWSGPGPNLDSLIWASGFVFAAIGLSLYFRAH